MLFNSLEFLVFFPAFLALYFLTRGRTRLVVCLVASYVFYAWWDWRFCSLILLSTGVDYLIGLRLGSADTPRARKLLLTLSCVVNLGVLALFKYTDFFIDSTRDALAAVGVTVPDGHLKLLLPVGISFYTFQTMSYTIDVYRRKIPVERDPLRFATYVAFFPQLVAGPIVRASTLLPQLARDQSPSWNRVNAGFQLILLGLFKKIVVADNAAPLVDNVFAQPELFTALNVLLGIYLYAIQIYCDFSGYSDIAIGIGRVLGFEFGKNFDKPYFSASFSEFWRRWHISLSTWLRDYLYVPLGGNRRGSVLTMRNLVITMFLGGLWHGAAWHFVIWGLLHGVYLVLQRLLAAPFNLLTRTLRVPAPIVRVFLVLLVFHLTCLAWVFFRAESAADAMTILGRIASLDDLNPNALKRRLDLARAVALAGVLIACELIAVRYPITGLLRRSPALRIAGACILVWAILFFGNFSGSAFIYFQF